MVLRHKDEKNVPSVMPVLNFKTLRDFIGDG